MEVSASVLAFVSKALGSQGWVMSSTIALMASTPIRSDRMNTRVRGRPSRTFVAPSSGSEGMALSMRGMAWVRSLSRASSEESGALFSAPST